MKKLLTVFLAVMMVSLLVVSCDDNSKEPVNSQASDKVYEIGDIGPAGGYVFYVADELKTITYVNKDGNTQTYQWKYLEAAPNDLDGKKSFGCNGPDQSRSAAGTSKSIGSGRENTRKLVNSMGTSADISTGMANTNNIGTDYAAYLCDDYKNSYKGEEFTDWFLPSSEELEEMYKNLKAVGKGGTWQSGIYWSSSEDTSYPRIKAFVVNFGSSTEEAEAEVASRCLDGSAYTAFIRPIRAFK